MQAHDLPRALTGNEDKPERPLDLRHRVGGVQIVPEQPDFIGGEISLPAVLVSRGVHPQGIELNDIAGYRIGKHLSHIGQEPVCLDRSAAFHHGVEDGADIPALDVGDLERPPDGKDIFWLHS